MSRYTVPTTLRIPFSWLKYTPPVDFLLAKHMKAPRHFVARHSPLFTFRNDEKPFVKMLLERKQNLWIFRTNQQHFCGDFVIVDMSSPEPERRVVIVLDLKWGASLRQGGGGAGIQFVHAGRAVEDIAQNTGIIRSGHPYQLLSGDKWEILAHLGIETVNLQNQLISSAKK